MLLNNYMKKIGIVVLLVIVVVVGMVVLFGKDQSVDNSGDVSAGSEKVACSRTYSRPSGETADQVLRSFFSYLANGEYCDAAAYFSSESSDYQMLGSWNPDLSIKDHGELWKQGCEHNGLACLPVGEIVSSQSVGSDLEFLVRFEKSDEAVKILVGKTVNDGITYFVKSLPPRTL